MGQGDHRDVCVKSDIFNQLHPARMGHGSCWVFPPLNSSPILSPKCAPPPRTEPQSPFLSTHALWPEATRSLSGEFSLMLEWLATSSQTAYPRNPPRALATTTREYQTPPDGRPAYRASPGGPLREGPGIQPSGSLPMSARNAGVGPQVAQAYAARHYERPGRLLQGAITNYFRAMLLLGPSSTRE